MQRPTALLVHKQITNHTNDQLKEAPLKIIQNKEPKKTNNIILLLLFRHFFLKMKNDDYFPFHL